MMELKECEVKYQDFTCPKCWAPLINVADNEFTVFDSEIIKCPKCNVNLNVCIKYVAEIVD